MLGLTKREIVRRFERPVFNLIDRLVLDRSTAEDLCQDTFAKVFRALHTFVLTSHSLLPAARLALTLPPTLTELALLPAAAHWQAKFPDVRLNVNLSPREFQEGDVIDMAERDYERLR